MKKLMTSTIIILPLILLAIMLVSGAVLPLMTHIYVDNVEFTAKDALVLVMKDESDPPTYDLGAEVNVLPIQAPNRGVEFESADESVVRVSADGVVTAAYYGETYVTVRSAENSAKTARRKVIVTDSSVHAIRFMDYEEEMYRDETQTLGVQVLPEGAGPATILYSSDKPEVLSVTAGGDIVCKGSGEVKITASLKENPSITDTAVITCHTPLESVSTSVTSVTKASRTMQFPELTVSPADATYTVTYVSSDENIATVGKNGEITFLKEGSVTVTANAEDGRGNRDSASVEFTCTDGYFMGELFTEKNYSFDYDEYALAGTPLEIELQKSPSGSYRKIVNVTFDREGLIDCDFTDEGAAFTLVEVGDETPLGDVKITITAQKYSAATNQIVEVSEDVCTVSITRKTSEIAFTKGGADTVGGLTVNSGEVTVSELAEGGRTSVKVVATPKNHTDSLTYSVTGNATLTGGVLRFSEEGEATVKVTSGDGTVTNSLDVTYVAKQGGDVDVVVNSGVTELNLALDFTDTAKDTGLLDITPPDGMKAEIASDKPEVVDVDGMRLVPKKGGFANITVKYVPDSSPLSLCAEQQCVITVYVDVPVTPDQIEFSVTEGYVTVGDKVSFDVTLNVKDGAMEGKSLYIGADGEEGTLVREANGKYSAERTFPLGKNDMKLFARVKYAPEAAGFENKEGEPCTGEVASKTRTVNTTRGKITSGLSVKYEGQPLAEGSENALIFPDMGKLLALTVSVADPQPADFVLAESHINFGAHTLFSEDLTLDGGVATVSLTSIKGGEETVELRIAGHTYTLKVKVELPAHSLEVKYAGSALGSGETYKTFLEEVDLTVLLQRRDSLNISEKTVSYTVGGGHEQTADVDGKTATLQISVVGTTAVTIKTAECEYTVTFEKVEPADLTYTYHIEYSDNGRQTSLDPFELDGGTAEYSLPATITGSFSICIAVTENNLLGGFTADIMNGYFTVTHGDFTDGWETESTAETLKIAVTIPSSGKYFMGAKLEFAAGASKVTLSFDCLEVGYVEFTDGSVSYDMEKNEDVFPGYQQARVFAKQSYYGGKVVDYFRLPVKAVKDMALQEAIELSSIKWIFTKYQESSPVGTLVSQLGNTVTYNGETYTIEKAAEGPSTLKKGAETIAAGGKYAVTDPEKRIPWVDTLAEEGYAHIYFGNFGGLSETDVQNDYFGNFGEQAEWSKVTEESVKDTSERKFTPSGNAYTYLRIDAGGGAKDSSSSAHFNFNVLEDSEVVNIFNAAGYYANSKVVLHNNLYGNGELGEEGAGNSKLQNALDNDLILENTTAWNSMDATVLGKNTVYGNGYQVNLQAKNEALKTAEPDKKNNSWGVRFGNMYNLVVKGANPTADGVISYKEQKIVLQFTMAYYCDLSNYTKARPVDGFTAYIKNTVLHSASQSGFQLYYTNESAYLENVTILECAAGLTNEKTLTDKEISGDATTPKHSTHYYFKGNFDVLNYTNLRGVASMAGLTDQTLGLLEMLVGNMVAPHYEWFGTKYNATSDVPYFNLAIYTSNKNCSYNYWDGEKYVENNTDITVGDNVPMQRMLDLTEFKGYLSGAEVTVWTYNYPRCIKYRLPGMTYDYTISVDGRNPGTNNGTQYFDFMFTEERYIRLLCQYVTADEDGTGLVKNEEHILWHMQEAYRDKSLLTSRKNNHMEALRDSLTGKDIVWPDKSTPEQAMEAYDAAHPANGIANSMNKLLSYITLPDKRKYA